MVLLVGSLIVVMNLGSGCVCSSQCQIFTIVYDSLNRKLLKYFHIESDNTQMCKIKNTQITILKYKYDEFSMYWYKSLSPEKVLILIAFARLKTQWR